jgi:hypothetical protein
MCSSQPFSRRPYPRLVVDQTVIAVVIRVDLDTQEIEATGADYKSARTALLTEIPEGHRLMHILTID